MAKIQNKFDKNTNNYDRNSYEITETDKTFRGRISLSKKEGETWISSSIAFVVFKNGVDAKTLKILSDYRGEDLNFICEPMLGVNAKEGKGFVQLNVKSITLYQKEVDRHNSSKGNGYAPKSRDEDDEIPF